MKDPERLFSSNPELARIRALLESDGPPEAAFDRAKRVLASSASVSSTTVGPAPTSKLASKLWLVAGLGVLVATGVALTTWPRATNDDTSAPSSASSEAPHVVATASAFAPANEAALGSSEAAPTTRVEDLPTASPSPSPAPSASARADTSASADAFGDELALVEEIRAALAKGNGRGCLEAVKRYEPRFGKSGIFREEVEVMRIEALAVSGDREQARARGARFLDVHRDTPYVDRVRRVLEQGSER